MATKTVTIDTNEWTYVDKTGIGHAVTNAETFTFELTDTSSTDVNYSIDVAQSVVTDDGYVVNFRNSSNSSQSANTMRNIGKLTDAMDAVATYGISGEMICECPVTGIIQNWVLVNSTIDDIDTPTELTALYFEDQFSNKMSILTATVA